MAMFAYASLKRPRGVVKNVVIQLGEFYYQVDFMVVDYAPSLTYEQPHVVLGRPFLYSVNAQIDCRGGIITMSYKNRTLYFNVFLKTISYDPITDAYHTGATNEHVSSVTKDRLEASGYQVKKPSVRRPVGEGKPPDGGFGWVNEVDHNPNRSAAMTFPKDWMEMYGNKWEGKRAAEPP
ncbi:putative aspartic peptidase domain superfamily [Helianthus debilis subsp. tardiflorus]